MYLKPNQHFYLRAYTISPTTAAPTNANSTPTAVLLHNGAVDGTVTLTIGNPATGTYTIAGTVPAGYVEGDYCQVEFTSTVGGLAATIIPDSGTWLVETSYISDVPTVAQVAAGILATPNNKLATDASGQVTVGTMAAAAVGSIWNALLSGMTTAGSVGKKLAVWILGTDNKALLSTDTQAARLQLSSQDEGVLTSLNTMIASNAFTAPALALAPASSGGGGSVTVAGYAAGKDPAAMLKADSDFAALLADANGVFDLTLPSSYPGNGTLVLKDKAGTTTLLTLTLQYDANQTLIHRVAA